jgi:hypothetical protein
MIGADLSTGAVESTCDPTKEGQDVGSRLGLGPALPFIQTGVTRNRHPSPVPLRGRRSC